MADGFPGSARAGILAQIFRDRTEKLFRQLPPLVENTVQVLGVGSGLRLFVKGIADHLKQVANSRVEMLYGSRHFPMLDEPDKFYTILASYLDH